MPQFIAYSYLSLHILMWSVLVIMSLMMILKVSEPGPMISEVVYTEECFSVPNWPW